MKFSVTTRQWKTLVVLVAANIFVFVAIGLLPPFFPALATTKGASPTQFGLVFSVFRLTMGLISPVYGHFMEKLGPKLLLWTGVLTTSGCCFLMGMMEYVDGVMNFIGLSIAIQIIAALGSAALTNVNLVLINKEFPKNSASVFSGVETTSGVGTVLGPLLGGILIQTGGYKLPFIVVGVVLILVTILGFYVLPEPISVNRPDVSSRTECSICGGIDCKDCNVSFRHLFKNFAFSMYIYITVATSFSNGFFQVTLEYHLRPMELSPVQVSLVFGLASFIYCVFCTSWGLLCDKILRPITIACWGASILVFGFLLLGPAPFISLNLSMVLVVLGTILFSIGNSAQVVSTFSGTASEALKSGAPDNVATYGLVGGIWNFFFCLSFCLGFAVGGFMLDAVGYQWASMVVVAVEVIGVIGTAILLCVTLQNTRYSEYSVI